MNHTVLLVLCAAILLGITSGILGCFALLRQQSLLGDAISHAALPGIVLMFLCTYNANPWMLLCGGALTGIIGVMCMNYIYVHTKLKKDAILGIILSVFFGLGLVLMTIVQKIPIASQAVLNKFLFGTISTVLVHDIKLIAVLSCFILCVLYVLWKECMAYTFDPVFVHMIGLQTHIIEKVLTMLLILAIVIGLQTVGVVLMSTMLIAPAAAARQWVCRFPSMVMLSAFLGGFSAATGVYLSSVIDHMPTGPSIVVVASMIVFISLIWSPKREMAS